MNKVGTQVRGLVHLLMTLVAACSLWAAGLLVCPKCGYEAADNATVCTHCGAAIPRRSTTTVAPSNTVAETEAARTDAISSLAMDAIRIDLRLAAECRETKPERAYAFYENVLALSRLVKRDAVTVETGKTLAEDLGRCREGVVRSNPVCPTCGGTGKRTAQFQSLLGDKGSTVRQTTDAVCLACNGKGTVRAGRSADDVRVLLGQGRQDFGTRETALGRVAVGRVWVPPELLPKLDVRLQALLRTACPTPCPECMGGGVQNCSRCRGAARVPCNNGCQDGMITRKESNTLLAKGTINRREKCPVCLGSGTMACPDCLGAGSVPCRTCRGTGRNANCQECGGQGWEACATCRGLGKQSNGSLCPDCQGHGERLCPRCHGEGCALR